MLPDFSLFGFHFAAHALSDFRESFSYERDVFVSRVRRESHDVFNATVRTCSESSDSGDWRNLFIDRRFKISSHNETSYSGKGPVRLNGCPITPRDSYVFTVLRGCPRGTPFNTAEPGMLTNYVFSLGQLLGEWAGKNSKSD